MDRFLSKLDLRDIKIKPEGNQFLPTDDEVDPDTDVEQESSTDDDHNRTVEEQDSYPGSADVSLTSVADSPLHVSTSNHHETETIDQVDQQDEVREETSQNQEADTEVLKVSAKSRPSAVAGAIAGVVRECGRAEVQAIGAGATNQAVKAVAIARDYLWESEIDAVCVPEFIDVIIDNEERTAIRLVVEAR